jgi:hypothetical protein
MKAKIINTTDSEDFDETTFGNVDVGNKLLTITKGRYLSNYKTTVIPIDKIDSVQREVMWHPIFFVLGGISLIVFILSLITEEIKIWFLIVGLALIILGLIWKRDAIIIRAGLERVQIPGSQNEETFKLLLSRLK